MVREYDYYEGSEVIDSVVDGGLAAFKKLPHGDNQRHRASAVRQIGRDACHNGKSALVTGHFILPNDGIDGGLQEVYTEADLETFTHIVYLKVPAEDIRKRCAADVQRKRALFPAEEMSKWHGEKEKTVQRVADLCSFWNFSEQQNSDLAVSMANGTKNVLKMVFGGPLGYTHRVFQQVSVLLASFECFNETYDSICDAIANQITVYPEMTNILSRATRDPRVIPVVVTSGILQVWEMALQRIGLKGIPIFGGGRARGQYIVTPQTKATIVEWLANINSRDCRRDVTVSIYIAPSTAAKLLASPMRDASIEGLTLQDARVQTGRFLATRVVTEVICLEKHTIPHLQGQNTSGYRLRDEKRNLIVAMMRGGEPMAKGVYRTFPLARYAFAKSPQDIAWRDVADMANILLVDSVVNTGKSMIDFVDNIRTMSSKAKILLVAGI
ncbi:hypothetical protein PoMZ_03446 [Pyricularia oryzae]|uniref:Phosphoribosyltransferase domain-containing protein n=1 Tax=Pyricularia oryzae TaxID=318829 RepID=A0A4P7N7Q4_PYROR|nr:hypothetical protein PoMZ_03446 [Pyricularia oryzae]